MARRDHRPGPDRPSGGDWPAQAADAVVRVVAAVRSKTTDPLVTVARALVYGLLAVLVGGAAIVLLVAGLVRGLDVAIPGRVWSTYLVVGGIFTLGGVFLLRKAGRGLRGAEQEGGGR